MKERNRGRAEGGENGRNMTICSRKRKRSKKEEREAKKREGRRREKLKGK